VAGSHQGGRPAGEGGGSMARASSEHWQDQPEAQDYPAAENYLSLLVGRPVAHKLAKALRKEIALEHFAAKDILRASGSQPMTLRSWPTSPRSRKARSSPRCC
jgi:hypothetical protein